MLMEVYVELWGQVEDSNSCNWITVGKIDADSLDIDYLKEKTMEIVNMSGFPSKANMARLRVTQAQKDAEGRPITLMKITLEDLW